MSPESSSSLLVELRNITFGYGDRAILRDLSLAVPRGKVTALMGASGGGKTTVLRLIGGQYKAQGGQLLFDGQDVGKMDTAGLYAARRRMGMLFSLGPCSPTFRCSRTWRFRCASTRTCPTP